MLYVLLAVVLLALLFLWLFRGDKKHLEEVQLRKRKAGAEWAEFQQMTHSEVEAWSRQTPEEHKLWCIRAWRKHGIR